MSRFISLLSSVLVHFRRIRAKVQVYLQGIR